MISVTDIKGIGPAKAETLEGNDYESVEDIAQADPDALSSVKGVSEDRALEYMVSAGDLLDAEADEGEDDEPESEFDLTPDEVGDELEEVEGDDEGDSDEEEAVVKDDGEEASNEPKSYTVSVDFDTRMQYHTFHAAIMRYHEKQYTSNQPKADAMQKLLDGLDNVESVSYELGEVEFNTLHTAIKQCRTDYQGDNHIDHMDALSKVEEQINDQRRELLF